MNIFVINCKIYGKESHLTIKTQNKTFSNLEENMFNFNEKVNFLQRIDFSINLNIELFPMHVYLNNSTFLAETLN